MDIDYICHINMVYKSNKQNADTKQYFTRSINMGTRTNRFILCNLQTFLKNINNLGLLNILRIY